ncbi:hypothetical protein PSV08DRAFT_364070 [Bipolaris maydis]|nr:hypothetical protein J3E73DRAFT_425544 [Bipolaris maydis]KAJ6269341.1 hypothetical protein PSV08DRAFT_364070 [Bipolaris maydis]
MIHTASDFAKKKYLIINEAGQGNCGKVLFCVSAPSASDESNNLRQSTIVAAVKTTQNGSLGLGLAQEILILQRIHSLITGSWVERHLPVLIDFDLPAAGPGSYWLATNAIQGFNLVQLIKALILPVPVCGTENSLSQNTAPPPALPPTLMLHITQQLVQTVAWLHTTAKIAHNDIFSGNIMLDISRCNFSSNPVILPSLGSSDTLCAIDRSSMYEFLYSLGEISGLFTSCTILQDATEFWGELMQMLVENELDRGLRTCTMGFGEFCARFEGEMVRQVESGVGAERERAKELVERVVAMREVEFPGEEWVREVLARDRDLK